MLHISIHESKPAPNMSSTPSNAPTGSADDNLYHVLLVTSHLSKDPNSEVEKIRVVGSYSSLKGAKEAAQSCLFEGGYEKEWFTEYKSTTAEFEKEPKRRRTGLTVLAVAPDGTTFRVHVLTTPAAGQWRTQSDDGRVLSDLYYVVQTTFEYEDSDDKDINIEGVFGTYKEARELASQVLLSEEDRIDKNSFAQYDEAKENERDCGFGENVIVHAVGANGENYLVTVVKGQALESVRLGEAAMRIS
jgi:hypothetical protein